MATMKITWSSLQRLLDVKALVLAFAISAIFLNSPSYASKGGSLAPETPFSVGYTFKLGGVEQICSGSLISPTVIVTAAHCVVDELGNKSSGYIFATPGVALDAPLDPTIKQPSVVKVFTVPGFALTAANEKDDIAFLQLDIPLSTKGFIRVATADEIKSHIDKFNLTGYGFGDVFESNSPYSTFTRSYPIQWNAANGNENTVQVTSPNASACSGDSGGPITAKLPTGEEVLVAAMSGAAAVENRCGTAANGIYTMRVTIVYPYINLVADILKAANPPPTPKPVIKKYKITCVKGKVKKYFSGTNPKCPSGYKQTSKVSITP